MASGSSFQEMREGRSAKTMILYCGDPHGQFDHIVKAALELRPGAVILLGDMEPQRPLEVELAPISNLVWWIPGNHDADADDIWARVWGSQLENRNIHGRVVTLPDGTRVAGLGGIFDQGVWYPEPGDSRGGAPAFRSREEHARATPLQARFGGGPHRKHWGTIYPCDVDDLADQRADVLVTHEAPGYHPNGFAIIDTLAQAMGVKLLLHGHHHDALDSSARWGQQGFKSFGVGLRGITSFDANGNVKIIVRGEIDERRSVRQRHIQ